MGRNSLAIVAFAILVALGGFCHDAGSDEASVSREGQLRAAYLFNFAKFVEWPSAAAGEPLTVCFIGASDVYDALAVGIEDKKSGGRPLAVRRLEQTSDLDGCNVLYLDAEQLPEGQTMITRAKLPMLTVSNAKGFARSGGMIELFTESNRLRFRVNIDVAHKAGLRISSDLLQLAASIEKGTGQ